MKLRSIYIAFVLILIAFIPAFEAMAKDANPLVVWDNAIRGPELEKSKEPGGCILFHKMLNDAVTIKRGIPADGDLEGAMSYVLYAPIMPVLQYEIPAIYKFLSGGGRMLLVVHGSNQLNTIMKMAGGSISEGYLRDKINTVKGHSLSFHADEITPHALTDQVRDMVVVKGFSLEGDPKNSTILVSTSPYAYIDTNGNGVHDDGTSRKAHAIVILFQIGKGQLLVVSSEIILANQSLAFGFNRPFAENVTKWLAGK